MISADRQSFTGRPAIVRRLNQGVETLAKMVRPALRAPPERPRLRRQRQRQRRVARRRAALRCAAGFLGGVGAAPC